MPLVNLLRIFLTCSILLLGGCLAKHPPDVHHHAKDETISHIATHHDPLSQAYFNFSKAIMLHNQGDLEGVVSSLEKTIEVDEVTPGLRLYLAEVLLQLRRDDEAVVYLEGVLAMQPDSVQAHRLLGEIYFENGDYLGAEREYQALVRLLPEDEDVLLLLVQTMSRRGLVVESIERIKEFIGQGNASYRGYYALARLYRQLDLTVSAEEAYRKVIELQPILLPVYLELGMILEKRDNPGDMQKAIDLYLDGLKHRPGDAGLRHRLVQVYLLDDDFGKAQHELESLLQDYPDDTEALRKLGLLYMEKKQWPDAASTFEHLLKLVDERATVRYYLGNVYENCAQPYEALREFLQIPQDSELFPDARIHAAYLYRMLGETDQALSSLEPLLEDKRLTVDQLLLMTSLAEEAGNTPRALQLLERGQRVFPGNTRVLYQRGALLEKAGMVSASREIMLEILELDPNHSEALNFIAYQNAVAGERLDEALAYAQRAIALNESGHIYDTLGWVHYRMGNYSDALLALKNALRETPDDPVIHEHLGDVYAALGDKDKAISHYRSALKLDASNSRLQEKLANLQ